MFNFERCRAGIQSRSSDEHEWKLQFGWWLLCTEYILVSTRHVIFIVVSSAQLDNVILYQVVVHLCTLFTCFPLFFSGKFFNLICLMDSVDAMFEYYDKLVPSVSFSLSVIPLWVGINMFSFYLSRISLLLHQLFLCVSFQRCFFLKKNKRDLTLSLPLSSLVYNTHTPCCLPLATLVDQGRHTHTGLNWEYHDQLLK